MKLKTAHGTFTIKNHVLIDFCPYKTIPDVIVVPNEAKEIGSMAFDKLSNSSTVFEIVLPFGLTTISEFAFFGLDSLQNINIPGTVTKIGRLAFSCCFNLQKIILPKQLLSIEVEAFNRCDNLTIYAETEEAGSKWHTQWNRHNCPVVWSYVPPHINSTFVHVPEFSNYNVLHIYKGNIRCNAHKNYIIQTKALFRNFEKTITLNVEYCTLCKKFMLEYTAYNEYKNKYGDFLCDIIIKTEADFEGKDIFSQTGLLKQNGYSVGKSENLLDSERQFVLAQIIREGIVSKGDVIKYISQFIRVNGAKQQNQEACEKWKKDLFFVQNYNINTQPEAEIQKIKKWSD